VLPRELVELLAVLLEGRAEPVVIDHADLHLHPLPPAFGADTPLDLVADGPRQDAARALTRLPAVHARDIHTSMVRARSPRGREARPAHAVRACDAQTDVASAPPPLRRGDHLRVLCPVGAARSRREQGADP